MKSVFPVLIGFGIVFFSLSLFADEASRVREPFLLNQVRLLPSPFKAAQDKDAAYLLSVDPDRLLAKFRRNAGLKPKADHYNGWEARNIAGHSLGHYLSALSFMYASTGDERFKERAGYIVNELAECQEAAGDGLITAVEDLRKVFTEVARGDIRTGGFDLNGLWVPWYAQHKVHAGLIDVYRNCGNEKAFDVVKKLGDWGIEAMKTLSDEQFQTMLRCEFGGMNESYYDLYALTGEEKYLEMGDRFYHHAILDPLREDRDELRGKHANTQIPKLVGLARRHEVSGDRLFERKTTEYFWDRVVFRHSYVTGGHSMGEHFGEPGKLNDRLGDSTMETCNTYNMLKLTKMLYTWTGDPKYMDFYERALFNHILPSIDVSEDPNRLFTYFVPLQSGGFRTHSHPYDYWSCCHGTGMENHGLYNGAIYYHGVKDGKDILYVNLLIPSTLDWKEKGVKVTVTGQNTLEVEAERPLELPIVVRAPRNTAILFGSNNRIGGEMLVGETWKAGKTPLPLLLEPRWNLERMPDNENRIAFFYGAYLYAGNLGPADEPLASEFEEKTPGKIHLPVLVAERQIIHDLLKNETTPEDRLTCGCLGHATLTAAKPEPVEMIPFYRAVQRYAVYFDYFTPQQWTEKQAEYEAERKRLAVLEALTVDRFQPGEMQPERDHDFRGEKTHRGEHFGRKWRDARDGGYLEFDMRLDPETPCRLELTYWGDDGGNRVFDILVDGEKIATQKLESNAPGRFFEVSHDIVNPEKRDKIRVRLQAHPGAMAGGLFGAKTLRKTE